MNVRRKQNDLLGKPVGQPRPKYELAMERNELASVPERAARVRWLNGVIPSNTFYAMPLESMFVFQEARDCFIYGQFVAAQVLAASLIEHWLGALLSKNGKQKVAAKGLDAIVTACREQRIIPDVLCAKITALRLNRNPFVHLKPFEHPHNLGQRMLASRSPPDAIVEADAREAMVVMYSVTRYAKAQV